MRDYPESVLKAAWARVRRPSCKTIQALQWLSGNNPAEKAAVDPSPMQPHQPTSEVVPVTRALKNKMKHHFAADRSERVRIAARK